MKNLEARLETAEEFQTWLARAKETGINKILTPEALMWVYLKLGNNCWRKDDGSPEINQTNDLDSRMSARQA